MPIISPKIPSGLEELMRGLAKSVIKENPQNIYEFAAEYFENLLKERDGSVDQSYKKFATYKVYKKNKNARLKREKENSNDVNAVRDDNGFRKDVVAVNYGNQNSYEKKDSSEEKSIEEIILPATSTPLQALPKSQSSISSESEINTTVKKDASVDVDGAPPKPDSNNDEDEDVKNMVLDEDMAQAALKIQSTFRGHKVRREMKETISEVDVIQEITTEEVEKTVSDTEIELKEPIEHDPEITDNIESFENMNDGVEVLKISNDENQNDEVSDEIEQNIDSNDVIETEIDDEIANMVLDDEMEQAALKIQSTFRGHKVRKEVKPLTVDENPEEILTDQPDESDALLKEEVDDNGSIQAENNDSMNDEAEKLSVDESVQVEDLVQNEDVEKENDGTTEQEKVEEIETLPKIGTVDKVDSQFDENEEVTAEVPIDASENFIVENDVNINGKIENDKDVTSVADDVVFESPDHTVDEANENQEEHSAVEKVEEMLASNELEKSVHEEIVGEEDKDNTDLPKEECEVGEQLEESDKVESTLEESLPEGLEENANNQCDDAEIFLEKELSVEPEATINEEMANIKEEEDENQIECDAKIESTDNIIENIQCEEIVNEDEIQVDKQQENDSIENLIEEKNIDEVNEEKPQEGLNELPNESETENLDIEDPEDFDDENNERIPVVEEICEKKSVHDLEPDQLVEESENIENEKRESLLDEVEQRDENLGQLSNQEKSPSDEVEYITLKESISDQGESVDEIDDKSQDLTDEKSIDGDETCGSKENSLDEKVEEIQDEVNVEKPNDVEEQRESFKDVDDIEMNSTTQQSEELGEREEHLNDAVESIIQHEISPIELMDEVVNECAATVASELFNENVEKLDEDLKNSTTAEIEEEAEQIIQPQLNEENPLKEIEAPKSIDLSQETVQVSQDEMEPIIDEILQPEKEDSEIPEETQAPMDENIPTVAMEEKVPSITSEEKLPNDEDEEKSQPQLPQVDDDVSDMVLDEEMEDAALKIQAAFRGHHVRKVQVIQQKSDHENQSEENAEDENSAENVSTNIVIDQCSEENQETQDHEETEQQNTSADVEEIEETETIDQEETLEETPEEENEIEEETAVESAENETTEQAGDDPDGTPEDETESAEQQQNNNDDDDVANMVLDEEMEQAALKIQSTFRGHKTRKDIKQDETKAEASSADATEEPKDPVQDVDDEIANMVLDDEMEQAALKIQSTFRGHKTRKDIKNDDNADEDDNNNDEKPEEKKEEKEEEKPKEEPSQSSSTEKSSKQLQEEEDIANLVMDAEMEQTALKIQSAFRGKAKKKVAKDGVEYSGDSSADQSDEDEEEEEAKSEDDPFRQNEEASQEEIQNEDKYYDDEEKGSNYSTAHYSQLDDGKYYIDRQNSSSDVEPMYVNTSIDDLNLMQGGGIFPEPSGESSDILTGCSGDDKNPDDRQSSYEKVSSHEIDETVNKHETVDPLNVDERVIENFDFVANKDTAEAMYYSLKKNEVEIRKQLTAEKQLSMSQQPSETDRTSPEGTMKSFENRSIEEDEDEDDDDVVIGVQLKQPTSAKRLKYGMSMDDRLLGSILSQDYATKAKKHGYPDDGFDPLLEATMKNQRFLEKLHEMSRSEEEKEPSYNDYPGDDEDQFDDFYHSNIRQKMMASSISIADSDYFDPMNNKSIIDDDRIRTALETIHSSDSESTIASAATKIQAGERINGKRNNHSMQYSSIGNAAIDRSLDEFIQSQELRVERFDEELEGYNSPPPRKQESVDDWTDDTTTYTDSDKKDMGAGGVIEIKLEQKTSFLTVDERRRTLHREDAIQRNSTREDEDSSKSSNASGEKLNVKEKSTKAVEETIAPQEATSVVTEIHVPILDVTEKSKSSSMSLVKPHRMKRQHTMPVQIQTDVIRVVPKHLRKRIKSADGDKNKRVSK